VQLEDSRHVTTDDMTRVIGLLKATFTHLIIDLSKGFNELDMFALNQADTILLVTQLDLPCLRNVVRLLMAFKDTPAIDQKVKVVVNRVGYETGQISLKKSQETMGREIYWQIPNDYRVMIEVRNNGVPLIQQAPKAAITQSICQLADSLSGKQDDSQDASSKVRSWLSLWPARA
jgi:pilus assembly protein CpaE